MPSVTPRRVILCVNVLLYGVVVLLWGSTWPAIRYQVEDVPIAASICYRSGLAAVLLLAYLALRHRPMRFRLRDHAGMVLMGVLMFSGNYLFLYAAAQRITSGLVALIFAMTLPMNVINSAIFLGRRIALSVVAATAVGCLGLTMVFWHDVVGFDLSRRSTRGVLLPLGAALCFSLGNIVSERTQRTGVPVVEAEAYGLAYGALLLAPVALLTEGFRFDLSARYVASLGYLVVFGSIVAFALYLGIVGRVGADRAGYVTVLFPIVALAWSTLIEHYVWTFRAVVGAALILIGHALVITPANEFQRLRGRLWRRRVEHPPGRPALAGPALAGPAPAAPARAEPERDGVESPR